MSPAQTPSDAFCPAPGEQTRGFEISPISRQASAGAAGAGFRWQGGIHTPTGKGRDMRPEHAAWAKPLIEALKVIDAGHRLGGEGHEVVLQRVLPDDDEDPNWEERQVALLNTVGVEIWWETRFVSGTVGTWSEWQKLDSNHQIRLEWQALRELLIAIEAVGGPHAG